MLRTLDRPSITPMRAVAVTFITHGPLAQAGHGYIALDRLWFQPVRHVCSTADPIILTLLINWALVCLEGNQYVRL